ncbi:DNA-binding winged helix-turn-helix (wHTH) protein/tetratricopeptide (TPR) repeat protein [Bradyrhizobium sp. USDA 4524]|uniref:winged helix-turn-helix domain-containing protein n=1 Tax=Bradyrhizobium TaxID=374 RepID=UPI0020A1EF51|nr:MULTISPECIES: winged helix-turn-helix domain-containing protein [Bradyrhizobium]MCP1842635.1 DNA-binding winged helix-turn-helix (wHTH) protein/tetratricopeptide (TPR) repeat protein [Bradyrhizobium sp. USDA 4538]MCP1903199.1 DNA-binding winged helix-turn-helix (wHTH) protein/tetratricopeptide (TPR) repeat protein [Bradyrhizobium sp. USDA 4537]MCP1991144.1 DNA-binding winged helix-turn-helix (wHTH) protein/tetratricopeptide (TPR) repeat protein [Bradyrhizobium sp. USDA 4539]MCP3415050.1 wing
MAFSFGLFELDEAGRVLLCARQEVPLQPRVFDLLIYLVRHRDRVIPKEELLEAVWPDVTVTDNSLQRAVSALRAALRNGGMDGAIRNLPGKGYRFFLESEIRQPERIDPKQVDGTVGAIGLARRAAAGQLWLQAATLFASADESGQLNAEDLHDWALALQCLGRATAAIPILVRAVGARSQAGDAAGATVDAIALSALHFESGQAAIGKGWLARAEDWASTLDDPPTTALVLWMKSKLAAFDGEPEQALALADAAYTAVRYKDAINIEALSLAYRGFYRLCLGDTHGGLSDQDHAAAVALSSNNLDPIMGGNLYCNILWAARMFGDWARADQWTRSYQNFCSGSGMELTGSCQLHRSEVLGIRGSLDEALARIQDALARLTSDAPWSLGDANRVLGDIQAAIGNDDAALEAYDRAYTLGWCPEPGRAMLLLARGEAEAAYASLERSLIGKTWWTLQRRGILLAHLALVAAHTHRTVRAKALICELSGSPDRWPMPSIRALTNEAQAILALSRQDHETAMRHLHLARQLWSSIEGRVQIVRLRLQISSLQLEHGDVRGAMAEVHAAQLLARDLGSPKRLAECLALQRDIDAWQPTARRQMCG